MKPFVRFAVIGCLAAVALPALASAADYPPPSNPGTPTPRPGGAATLKVCKTKACKYKTIQKAVNAARAGDKIKVANGTYREGVVIEGAKKEGISITGNTGNPAKVLIDAKGKRHGVIINSANNVTLRGLSTHGYVQNGFFAVNVDGYTMDRLLATGFGVYGLYAFNSKGGTMTNSEAYYNTDAGFYIGQTPVQDEGKIKRTFVRNISSWGNVLGWSGTNMRYVTITKSYFFNNATGVVPNALISEKYPPEEDNVISDNDIFWNNYNYYKGSPFPKVSPAAGSIPYPIGIGLLLFGGRNHTISNNRVFGNWGAGLGLIEQVDMWLNRDKVPGSEPVGEQPWVLRDNQFVDNQTGNGGKDLNGRDLAYDGSGSGNCFSGNQLTAAVPSLPAFNTTAFPTCNDDPGEPGPANSYDEAAQLEAIGWALSLLGNDKKPGGMLPQPVSTAYKGYKPFAKAADGDYMVWKKGYKAPPVPK